ncbi:hypothetical protein [Paenibacillus alba]|uniref:Uncharacterized protein n=1 Tax=Paenibacillus alba TaxID=1197127 RepID=A0ABU6G3P3_9BACL|nr:hypothetical protein [Paenibacillus alba]MEC0228788.1 hypothetical protein [Paenibacillus alba]NQX68814.1 hypothetical protein [Paenibacillus alba]
MSLANSACSVDGCGNQPIEIGLCQIHLSEQKEKQSRERMNFYGKPDFVRNPKSSMSYEKRNFASIIVSILIAIACIELIVALILGYSAGNEKYSSSFRWSAAFIWWGSGITSAAFIFGFSQIIQLLHEINSKMK